MGLIKKDFVANQIFRRLSFSFILIIVVLIITAITRNVTAAILLNGFQLLALPGIYSLVGKLAGKQCTDTATGERNGP